MPSVHNVVGNELTDPLHKGWFFIFYCFLVYSQQVSWGKKKNKNYRMFWKTEHPLQNIDVRWLLSNFFLTIPTSYHGKNEKQNHKCLKKMVQCRMQCQVSKVQLTCRYDSIPARTGETLGLGWWETCPIDMQMWPPRKKS